MLVLLTGSEVNDQRINDQQILDEALAILNGKPVSNVDILYEATLHVVCSCYWR